MKDKIKQTMLGWVEHNEPLDTTADKILALFSVSGALPTDLRKETISVLETLINNFQHINADGEPQASTIDIVDGWIKARDLLLKLRQ